jgi:hypothetical protein
MKVAVVLLIVALAGCASRSAGENRDYDAPGRVGTSYGLPDSPHSF